MKKTFLIFLLALSSYSLMSQNKTDFKSAISSINDWNTIKDVDAAYIIHFPGQPEKGAQDVPTEKGNVKMNTYTLQTTNDVNIVYMASFTKYPDSFFPYRLKSVEKQKEVLGNSVDGAVTNTNGTLIFEEEIFLNGYRGKLIKILLNGDSIIQMKVILVDISLYLAQVIYKKENEDNKNAKRFFDSLELINVKR